MMDSASRSSTWIKRIGLLAMLLVAAGLIGSALLSRADGPLFIFAGGPFRSGEQVGFADLPWKKLDTLTELEMEIVGAESSRVLWFSVYNDMPYVACDLDCVGGRLERWPQQIEKDNRVVIRVEGKRVDGILIHVPHGTPEYTAVRAGRDQKYSGEDGGRAATETAAHATVVGVGEVLTGRVNRDEPGDRLFRVDPR